MGLRPGSSGVEDGQGPGPSNESEGVCERVGECTEGVGVERQERERERERERGGRERERRKPHTGQVLCGAKRDRCASEGSELPCPGPTRTNRLENTARHYAFQES